MLLHGGLATDNVHHTHRIDPRLAERVAKNTQSRKHPGNTDRDLILQWAPTKMNDHYRGLQEVFGLRAIILRLIIFAGEFFRQPAIILARSFRQSFSRESFFSPAADHFGLDHFANHFRRRVFFLRSIYLTVLVSKNFTVLVSVET